MRSYAIGDIHGQIDLLERAHQLIAKDRDFCGDHEAPVVHLGDLVDRGPDSAGVIRYLRDGIAAGHPWEVLQGNHDRLFHRFMADPDWRDTALRPDVDWLHAALGGAETLMSYGIPDARARPLRRVHDMAREQVPREDVAFLAARPLTLMRGEVLFVHAGIRPGVPLEAQTEQDLVWIREPFLSDTREHGLLIIHGHTAIPEPTHYRNRVNIDSRAAYGGPLTVIVVEKRQVWALTETGREPLTPL